MTKTQAAELQAKWNRQGKYPPLCEHPIQVFVRLARSDDGLLLGTYHCRECGGSDYLHRQVPALLERR